MREDIAGDEDPTPGYTVCSVFFLVRPRFSRPFSDQGKWATGMMKKLEPRWPSAETCQQRGGTVAWPRDGDGAEQKQIRAYLLELSATPARALYQARNAAIRPNHPPALMQPGLGSPAEFGRR